MRYVLLLALLVFGIHAAEETTQTRLSRFGKDLIDAWTTYPKEKDETVRKQKITDLNNAFTAEIRKLPPPENQTLDKLVESYLSNLERAKNMFRLEKMLNEKQQYITVCGQVFRYEAQFATDLKEQRTASKNFDTVRQWAVDAKARLSRIPEEARLPFYAGLGEVFTSMMKYAKKDEGDPTAIYDKQLKDVRRAFPVATEEFQKVNQAPLGMLEGAAKLANTFNKKP